MNFLHGSGDCPAPAGPVKTMHVIDLNGIISVSIRFCGCSRSTGRAGLPHVQVLRSRWYPATFDHPQTAVTFRCLDFACQLNNQGKITGYDFYHSLVHLTDITDIDPPKVGDWWLLRERSKRLTYLLTYRNATMNSCVCSACGSINIC